ncbi:hypothetical protein [Leptospira santarosai]|uniref:hypothetical protein n=1 Tax=Leptospira santarosai TaxID=28183 RepID=UPI0002BF045E|nr:hypothetical protein [Leptospira santarosai]EMO85726.1 hypothetical protein LEP1GSC070_2427 [Leptospira santarosai str. AIM]
MIIIRSNIFIKNTNGNFFPKLNRRKKTNFRLKLLFILGLESFILIFFTEYLNFKRIFNESCASKIIMRILNLE